MVRPDRLSEVVWPSERNVGGAHRTARYVGGPALFAVGVGSLVGWLPIATGSAAVAVGVAALLAGGISLVEAHTRTCPGYAALGIDTCQVPDSPDGEEAGSGRGEGAA